MPAANPLDAWTAARIGSAEPLLQRQVLRDYQLRRLRETVAWAKRNSPFYRRHLAAVDVAQLSGLDDLRRLPLTSADDLRRNDPPLLCVSQSEISHVVTLETSGTSGTPKRLFFTPDDLDATLDFFAHGMRLPARAGDRVLILFPGERAGSVGDLLARALACMGASAVMLGWPRDLSAAATVLRRERPDVVAGAPVPMLALARYAAALDSSPIHIRSVLLSADHVAASVRHGLAKLWGCEVYDHYGMTEMGLGGGVDCSAHAGYHVRESELLVEVIDPVSGEPVAPGTAGEVVFSTLNRCGMPLIRYRTGDLSRLLPGVCACGSVLTRLERIIGRVDGGLSFADAGELTIGALDEVIFSFEEIADFEAIVEPGTPPVLNIVLSVTGDIRSADTTSAAVSASLSRLPPIAASGLLLVVRMSPLRGVLAAPGKRRIRIRDKTPTV